MRAPLLLKQMTKVILAIASQDFHFRATMKEHRVDPNKLFLELNQIVRLCFASFVVVTLILLVSFYMIGREESW